MNILALQKRLSPVLAPLGAAYAALMAGRRKAYEKGLVYMYRPARPCVSVGNISWGGSGKTPLIEWLLGWSENRNLKSVVLTRGYKGRPGNRPLLVEADTPARFSGDEALMLAQRHPKAHVLAFPRRSEAASLAEEIIRPDLFLLDDGMQHLGVARDLDMVLLRPEDLTEEWNKVIPAGSWREGKAALNVASAFCIKAEPAVFTALAQKAEERLAGFNTPLFSFSLRPKGLIELGRDRTLDAADYTSLPEDMPYILASGVGQPAQVEVTVAGFLGRPPARHVKFPDHHNFSEDDILHLAVQDVPVVCTIKDAVKLNPLLLHREKKLFPRFLALDTEAVFGPALFTSESFPQWWERHWESLIKTYGETS